MRFPYRGPKKEMRGVLLKDKYGNYVLNALDYASNKKLKLPLCEREDKR